MKLISIIILSCNNPYIAISIDSVYSHLNEDDEIIVVDDHSDESIIKILHEYQEANKIKLLRANRHGNRAYNRNLGAKMAQNDILFFMDGDIVMCDNSIDDLRKAHEQREEIAFIGPKFCIHYSDIHFKLYSNIDNYIELLKTPSGRKQLIANPLFSDERSDFWNIPEYRQFFWLNYYTGASSVSKDIFHKAGGFDESFETWGSEDVDLGYRINKYGKIGFLPRLIALHIPHPRNIVSIETTNFENILFMMKKYRTWEFEVLHSFSARPDIFISFFNIINQMILLNLKGIDITQQPNSVFLDVVSSKNPNGKLTVLDKDGKQITFQLIGITTTFRNKEFDTVYISDSVFIYPPVVVSRIMQEMLRVGQTVLILSSHNNIRIDWSEKVSIPAYHSNSRIKYNSDDLMDYQFRSKNGMLEIYSVVPNEEAQRNP